ncbi:MAG: hypothetical protein ACI391_04715 [Muribaculaceae bacterium]
MKKVILFGAMALMTACGSSRKAVENHTVEKYHQHVEVKVRTTDSVKQWRVLMLDSPMIEVEVAGDSVSPPRKVRIVARRLALGEQTTATSVIVIDSAATTQANRRADAKQIASRSHPWLVIAVLFAAIFFLRKLR